MPSRTETLRSPLLPKPLTLPLQLVPNQVHNKLLVLMLNQVFAPELRDGELVFLEHHVLRVEVTDTPLRFHLTLSGGRFHAAPTGKADLSISGSVCDFLLLATRREDADTLFFNRRLKLGGNTELGLYVKNFLDGLELEGRLGSLLKLLNLSTDLLQRFS
jgi:predicted lipid carrier protein YhbT